MTTIVSQIEQRIAKPQPVRKMSDIDLTREINDLTKIQAAVTAKPNPNPEQAGKIEPVSEPEVFTAAHIQFVKMRLGICLNEQFTRKRLTEKNDEKQNGRRRSA